MPQMVVIYDTSGGIVDIAGVYSVVVKELSDKVDENFQAASDALTQQLDAATQGLSQTLTDQVNTDIAQGLVVVNAAVTVQINDEIATAQAQLLSSLTVLANQQISTQFASYIAANPGISRSLQAVSAATATDVALTGVFTVDGRTMADGERYLALFQSAGSTAIDPTTGITNSPANGIYIYNSSGAHARASDMDAAGEFVGARVSVNGGSTKIGNVYQCQSIVTTLGTSKVNFVLVESQSVAIANETAARNAALLLKADESSLTDARLAGLSLVVKNDASTVANLYNAAASLAILVGIYKGGQKVGWDRAGGVVANYLALFQDTGQTKRKALTANGITLMTNNGDGEVELPGGLRLDQDASIYSLREFLPILKSNDDTVIGLRRDGIDMIPSQMLIDRIQGRQSTTAFEGDARNAISPIDQDDDARYVGVSIPGGPTLRIKQLTDEVRTIAVPATSAPMYHAQFIGQSNAGYISGPNIPEPIIGKMAQDVALTINNGTINCIEGSLVLTGAEAADFSNAVEPISPSNGQNPAHLYAYAFVRLLETLGQQNPGVAVTAAFKGGTPWNELYKEVTTNTIHANALGQSTAVRRLATTVYGKTVKQGIHIVIGEAGPDATGAVKAVYDSIRNDELLLIGGGTLPPVFISQINTATTASEGGSAIDMVTIARAYPGEVHLVGPMYDAPMIGPDAVPSDDIHSNNFGRMIWTERAALAAAFVQALGRSWNAMIPTQGAITRSGAVITVPISLPPGCSFGQVGLDNPNVPAITNKGFLVKFNGVTQTISSVTLDRINKAIIITLDASPGGAGVGLLRYGCDNMTPHPYYAGSRGTVFVDSGIKSPFNAAGQPVPPTICHPMVRTQESFS